MGDLSNDIKKYLRGELTAPEMHALERKALNDPFLAEALEGASSIPHYDFQKDLSGLQASIRKRVARSDNKTIVWNWQLRIAAAILLIAVSSYTIFTMTDESLVENQELSLNKKEDQPEKVKPVVGPSIYDSATQPERSSTQPRENNQSLLQEAAESAATSSPVDNLEQKPSGPIVNEPAVVPAREDESVEEVTVTGRELAGLSTPASGISVPAKKDAVEEKAADVDDQVKEAPTTRGYADNSRDEDLAKRKTRAQEPVRAKESAKSAFAADQAEAVLSAPKQSIATLPLGKVISGRVTDAEDGTPMPGVDIVVKGTTRGTITDLRGNYEITLPEKDSSLVFSFIGLQSKEVTVNNSDSKVDVSLSPDLSQLSEVVVIGYAPEPGDKEEDTSWQIAEPEGGRKEYKKYLEKNMTYPEQALKNNVEGRVTAQFTIQPNGQLTDFRVTKSLGYGCDEEVIRLIKQGPSWTPSKRNTEPVKGKVKVKMRFALPGKK